MPVLKEIEENLKSLENIETIIQVYQEVANLRMNKIRQEVLRNRRFIEDLSEVYLRVNQAYNVYFKNKKRREKIEKKKGRIVIFFSANQKFYGNLILEIFSKTAEFLKKKSSDLIIIGRIGRSLMEKTNLKVKKYYFELDDNYPEKKEIKKIIELIKNYKEIIAFHGKFHTILSQKVTETIISKEILEEKERRSTKNYLFEPSPEEILDFFERELFSSFFYHSLLEHQLAKYASRTISMFRANENLKNVRNQLEIKKKRLISQLFNKKQINLFGGYHLWEREE